VGAAARIPVSGRGLAGSQAETQVALEYAHALHRGQVREIDGAPFIVHPLEVAALLHHAGAPDHLVAAGALHDVIEKTSAGATDLGRWFGGRVASLVLAVTEDDEIRDYAARKLALRRQAEASGEEAMLLLAADKISKARELRLESGAHAARRSCGKRSRRQALTHYSQCLALLRVAIPTSPLVGALGAELEALYSGR
jgi:(p)ppGpp synthase/HD superfamily hydrolase